MTVWAEPYLLAGGNPGGDDECCRSHATKMEEQFELLERMAIEEERKGKR